jgi:hypothetical protein
MDENFKKIKQQVKSYYPLAKTKGVNDIAKILYDICCDEPVSNKTIVDFTTLNITGNILTVTITVDGVAQTKTATLPSGTNNAWNLTGNTGTDSNVNFIGTIDNQPLIFKSNNTIIGSLGDSSNWNINFGVDTGKGGISSIGIGNETFLNFTNGQSNVVIGDVAGQDLISGDNNTLIGQNTEVGENATNRTAIGSHALVEQDNTIVLGGINNVNTSQNDTKVGIGTTTPSEKLHIQNGKIKIVDGTQGIGKILVSDADGVGSWANPSGSGSVSLPDPIEYTVSIASPTILSPIENAGTTAILTSFIGLNVEFIRNKINETTDNTDSSFYSYVKATGVITIFPAATIGERFKFKLG